MPTADYTPTVDEIAALLPTRAKSEWGDVGRFTDRTKPSILQVQQTINLVVSRFEVRIGRDLKTDALKTAARFAASIRVAMLLELTKFQEQIRTGQSPYRELRELWDEAWPELLDMVTDANEDRDTDDGSLIGPGGMPLGSFDLCDDMIGMHTEF